MPYQIELLMYSGRFTISEQIHQTNWNTKRFCIAKRKEPFNWFPLMEGIVVAL